MKNPERPGTTRRAVAVAVLDGSPLAGCKTCKGRGCVGECRF